MTQEWQAGRLDSDLHGVGFDTLAVRAGQRRTPEGEHGEALFTSSSYVFRSAAEAAAVFAGEQPGNVYSRYTNPTVRTFEERIAALEGAEQAVATASGMAAILAMVMSLCSAGDHVLVSRSVFGATVSLFDKYFKRFGVQVDYVPLTDLQAWRDALRDNTRLLFVESPSNPLAELVDIAALAEIAHAGVPGWPSTTASVRRYCRSPWRWERISSFIRRPSSSMARGVAWAVWWPGVPSR